MLIVVLCANWLAVAILTTTLHTQQSPCAIVNLIGISYLASMNSIPRPYCCVDWCFKNGIKIYPLPKKWKTTEYELQIEEGDKVFKSPFKYKEKDIWDKIYEMYCHYYDENN